MPAQRKTQGRIAPAKAKEEANTLARLLTADPPAAVVLAGELAQAFTLPPRMAVVRELGSLLAGTANPPPFERVIRLLAEFRVGLKPAQEPEYAAGVLDLAVTFRVGESTLAEELLYSRVTEGGTGSELALHEEALPAALVTDHRYTPAAARAIRLSAHRGTTSAEVVERWMTLLEPLTRPGRNVLQVAAAGDLLSAFAVFPPAVVPDGAVLGMARFLVLCADDHAAAFYQSDLGRRLLTLLKITHPAAMPAPSPVPPHPVAGASEIWSNFRKRMNGLVDDVIAEAASAPASPFPLAAPAPEAATDLARIHGELDKLKAALAQLEQDKADALADAARARQEAEGVVRRLDELAASVEESRADAEKWKGEARRREDELGGQFRVEQHQEVQRQARLVLPPLREVHDHLARLLMADRQSEPLRRLGVSFDSLQKNLGRILGSGDIQRLPQELLVRPDEGTATDEPGN